MIILKSLSKYIISKYIILYILAFLFSANCSSQKKLSIGIKFHPNLTFSSISKNSNFNKKYFKQQNFNLGFNIGVAINYRKNDWLIEASSNIFSNKAGMILQNFSSTKSDFAKLGYNTLSFSNQLLIAYKVSKTANRIGELFIYPTVQYNLYGISKLYGKGNIQDTMVLSYTEFYPNINKNYNNIGIGIGCKIRKKLKGRGKIDYGLSYIYLLKTYPQLKMEALKNNININSIYIPRIHIINIDFIYYFRL